VSWLHPRRYGGRRLISWEAFNSVTDGDWWLVRDIKIACSGGKTNMHGRRREDDEQGLRFGGCDRPSC